MRNDLEGDLCYCSEVRSGSRCRCGHSTNEHAVCGDEWDAWYDHCSVPECLCEQFELAVVADDLTNYVGMDFTEAIASGDFEIWRTDEQS